MQIFNNLPSGDYLTEEDREDFMPVFDFSNAPEKENAAGCTYSIFRTNASVTSPE